MTSARPPREGAANESLAAIRSIRVGFGRQDPSRAVGREIFFHRQSSALQPARSRDRSAARAMQSGSQRLLLRRHEVAETSMKSMFPAYQKTNEGIGAWCRGRACKRRCRRAANHNS